MSTDLFGVIYFNRSTASLIASRAHTVSSIDGSNGEEDEEEEGIGDDEDRDDEVLFSPTLLDPFK